MTEQVACRRCRIQKLRCDRGRPSCARCLRTNASCSYAPPPDRKQIAAKRRAPARRTRLSIVADTREGTLTAADKQLLIDVYFTYVFKASLILHRPTFDRRFQHDELPDHALLAVLALALNFTRVGTLHNQHHRTQLQRLGDHMNLAEEFAVLAGKKVLPNMDDPSLDDLQTCHNLGFFWFARGQSQKNATFSGLAYRSARNKLMEGSDMSWLEAEQLRRCFWAGWLQTCVNSDDYIVGSPIDGLALETLLPASEACYKAGVEEAAISLAQISHAQAETITDMSIWAQLFSLLAHWTTIRDHIAARRAKSTSDILQEIQRIQHDLELWSSRLHPTLAYTRRNLCEHVVYKPEPLFATIHAMLYQSHLSLHASLVSRFQGNPPADLAEDDIKSSTQEAIRSAHSLADLASDLISLNCDFAALPPYIGYCMYIAGSIQLTMINGSGLASTARAQLDRTLTVLKAMVPFWAILSQLHSRLLNMCEAQLAKGLPTIDDLLSEGDSLSTPMPAYSLTDLKREGNKADHHSGMSADHILDITFDDMANTQIDFDLVDPSWWLLDVDPLTIPELPPMSLI